MAHSLAGGKLKLGPYEVNMLDKIGQGSYGVVYKGTNTASRMDVAAKQCDVKSDKAGDDAMLEIKHFQSVQNHPHIVQLFDFYNKDRGIWMIMEYCDAGDLDHYFKQKVPDMKEQVNIMYQSASAVSYMHCQVNTVIHRDIKPGNILMKIQGGQTIVKVTDFGLSKIVESVDPAKSFMFTSKAGTPGFMAPEFFLRLKYGKSVDVFALGLVFLAMIGFKSGDDTLAPVVGPILVPIGAQMANLAQMKIPIPDFVKDNDEDGLTVKCVKKLMRRMLKYAPAERCAMRQVVAALEDMGGCSPNMVPTTIPKGRMNTTSANSPIDSTPVIATAVAIEERIQAGTKSPESDAGEAVSDMERAGQSRHSHVDPHMETEQRANYGHKSSDEPAGEGSLASASSSTGSAVQTMSNTHLDTPAKTSSGNEHECLIEAGTNDPDKERTTDETEDAAFEPTFERELQGAKEMVDNHNEKEMEPVITASGNDEKPTMADSITAEDTDERRVVEANVNQAKDSAAEPEKEYLSRCEESTVMLDKDLSSTNEDKEKDTDKDEGATGQRIEGTSPNQADMFLGSITDNNYGRSGLDISRNQASNVTWPSQKDITSSFIEVTDLGNSLRVKVPPGVPVPEDGDDETDEKFLLARQGLEQALKAHLDVDDDVIAGMRDLKWRELLMQFAKHDEAVNEFEVGDQVIVLDDASKVRRLQDGYGGYSSRMARYLGKPAIVKEKLMGRALRVIHDDGMELSYNPKALRKTGERPFQSDQMKSFGMGQDHVNAVKSKFQRFDIVILSQEKEVVQLLQEEHGLWEPGMLHTLGVKGLVNRVNSNGDVFVEFINGDDWTVNPEALIACYITEGSVDIGDFVIVYCDKRRAKERQRELGLWHDDLEDLIGHSGRVEAVSGETITVDMGRTVKWHKSLIKLVAKQDEFLETLMRKSMRL